MAASVVLLLCSTRISRARLINVTIDDEYGDARTGLKPQYEPAGPLGSLFMSAKDDPDRWEYSRTHNGTLHYYFNGRSPGIRGNMTLTFSGTALYVFLVVDAMQDTDVPFYLDDAARPAGNYRRPSTPFLHGHSVYLYNNAPYKLEALEPGTHRVRASFAAMGQVAFDYALYTTEDDRAPEQMSTATLSQPSANLATTSVTLDPGAQLVPVCPASNLLPAAGGSFAGAVLAIALCMWLFSRIRRRRRRTQDSGSAVDAVVPFAIQPAAQIASAPSSASGNPLKQCRAARSPARERSRGERITFFKAELERVREESARERAEIDRMREENELLRQVAVPPPYSDRGSSSVMDHA